MDCGPAGMTLCMVKDHESVADERGSTGRVRDDLSNFYMFSLR